MVGFPSGNHSSRICFQEQHDKVHHQNQKKIPKNPPVPGPNAAFKVGLRASPCHALQRPAARAVSAAQNAERPRSAASSQPATGVASQVPWALGVWEKTGWNWKRMKYDEIPRFFFGVLERLR